MKKKFIALSLIAFVFCGVQYISAQTDNTTSNLLNRDVVLTETPQPVYTNAARENSVEGTITARVTFKADGTIGKIFLVTLLPNGLNQKAIEAAKKIKFLPALKNNVPITVVREIKFNFTLTNGVGKGFGSGYGDGIGSGRGKGSGTGSGSGDGAGIGLGDDDGDEVTPKIIKSKPPVVETKTLLILSKPYANYTDAARQNNIQGTVILRVTFNANGTIGEVTPISTLPFGLTEQAISAAKRMRFQPAMKNGVPYTVTKQVPYTFTIY